MRHRKSFNHLGRKTGHRNAMLANMASSLIMHKRIKTTTAKAKALRVFVEPLITKSKEDSTHSRRVVFSYLQSKDAVTELFREVSPKIADRPGGYTRILKTGKRLGDNADMCIIELVDYNENLLTAKQEAGAKSGRKRRRGGGKKKTEGAQTEAPDTAVEALDTAVVEDVAELVEEKTEEVIEEKAADETAVVKEKVEEEKAVEEEVKEVPEVRAEEVAEEKEEEKKKDDSKKEE